MVDHTILNSGNKYASARAQRTSIAALLVIVLSSLIPVQTSLVLAEPVADKRIQVPFGMVDFDNPDVSVYETLSIFRAGQGICQFQSNLAKSGRALNLESGLEDTAFLSWSWGIEKSEWTGYDPLWMNYAVHLRMDIYVFDDPERARYDLNPNSYYLAKLLYDSPNILNSQIWLKEEKIFMCNSTGFQVSAQAFSFNSWHTLDICFNFEKKSLEVCWDDLKSLRLQISETNPSFRNLNGVKIGDDSDKGSAGHIVIDNMQAVGEADVVGSGKPTYIVENIPLKGECQQDITKLLQIANKTSSICFNFFIHDDFQYLGNETVTNAIKSFAQSNPSRSAVGLWLDWTPSTESVVDSIGNFWKVFGFYPQCVGAYTLSSTVIQTLEAAPYNCRAFLCCVPDANGYSQFWNYPFFISDNCKLVPSATDTSTAVGFQWSQAHPLWYSMDSDAHFMTQSDYSWGGVSSSQPINFQYLIWETNNKKWNDFGILNTGLETDCDWVNATRAQLCYNWTTLAWDALCNQYPNIIQSKTISELANIISNKYSRSTPLYLLYYPNWRNTSILKDTWIIENTAYRSFIFRNSSYFGLISLEVFGDTSLYPFNNGNMFSLDSSYPEIMRSSEIPWHGISIDGFNPTEVVATRHSGSIPYVEIEASNKTLAWIIKFFPQSIYMTLMSKGAPQNPTLRFLVTSTRVENKSGWGDVKGPIVYDWGAIIRIDGQVYSWSNLTVHEGSKVNFGFNCSSIFLDPSPRQILNIQKDSSVNGEKWFNFSYSYSLTSNAEANVDLYFGFDAAKDYDSAKPSTTLSPLAPPFLLVLSASFVIAGILIGTVFYRRKKGRARAPVIDS